MSLLMKDMGAAGSRRVTHCCVEQLGSCQEVLRLPSSAGADVCAVHLGALHLPGSGAVVGRVGLEGGTRRMGGKEGGGEGWRGAERDRRNEEREWDS